MQRARAYSCDTQIEVVGEGKVESQATLTQPNNELSELKECLRKQQAQLDMLVNHFALNNTRPLPSVTVIDR